MTTPIAALYALPPGFFATAVADGDASPVADQLPPPDAAAEAVAPPRPRRASEPAEDGGALTCRACGIGERERERERERRGRGGGKGCLFGGGV